MVKKTRGIFKLLSWTDLCIDFQVFFLGKVVLQISSSAKKEFWENIENCARETAFCKGMPITQQPNLARANSSWEDDQSLSSSLAFLLSCISFTSDSPILSNMSHNIRLYPFDDQGLVDSEYRALFGIWQKKTLRLNCTAKQIWRPFTKSCLMGTVFNIFSKFFFWLNWKFEGLRFLKKKLGNQIIDKLVSSIWRGTPICFVFCHL